MPDPRYTAEQVDAAVALLGDPERFAHAQEIVTHAAPGLQRILGEALHAGGFFDSAVAPVSRARAESDIRQCSCAETIRDGRTVVTPRGMT